MTETKKPIKSVKVGTIDIALWDNSAEEKSNNITLTKSWLKKDGDSAKKEDWEKKQIPLFENEVSNLLQALIQFIAK